MSEWTPTPKLQQQKKLKLHLISMWERNRETIKKSQYSDWPFLCLL